MTILVIGSGAIGSSLAQALSRRGLPAFLAGRDVDKVRPLADKFGFGHTQCDVLEPGSIQETVAAAGPDLSGLAYCVGDITLKRLGATTEEDFLSSFRLNVLGAAQAVQAAQKTLLKNGKSCPSSVVFFSSVAASNGFSNHSVIGTSKAAIQGLTVSLAAELSPYIRVNCIAPSLSVSGIAAPLLKSEATQQAIAKMHPMQRLGSGDDHAEMAAFLLSQEAGWITGQVIGVDGGRGSILG